MKLGNWFKWQPLTLIALLYGSMGGFGFSMLGPWADWMNLSEGYKQPGDIGGPMNLGESYRWNMPVVTYGFDRSFLDFFGTNGVAAVEAAIGILNASPPVSSLALSNYPVAAWGPNWTAVALNLYDLKSVTLFLLLEQMGLTDPVRYDFCIRDYYRNPGSTNYMFDVIERNFDPTTAQPSSYVNGESYTYEIQEYSFPPTSPTNKFCDAIPFVVDPSAPQNYPATTASALSPGYYLRDLSQDDVGGLRYLLSGSQVYCESLLSDVQAVGTNTSSPVRTADRPGIEKVTFVRHPYGTLNGEFMPFTNIWTDIYYGWDSPAYQDVERITTSPDILFTGQDLGPGATVIRSGTTNWANNADLNGNSGGAGPGVIQPPITITFNTVGRFYVNGPYPFYADQAGATDGYSWASFDGSTNFPIVYPNVQIAFQPTQVNFRLLLGGMTNNFHWSLAGAAYALFCFQTASNLSLNNWTTLATLTNSGEPFSYQFQAPTNDPIRFFRTIQQP